jgi:hypothetical protein
MTESEVQVIKRIQYLEYKLEIVYQALTDMQTKLDEYEEA